jgi:choline dehydrogenase
MKNDQTSVFRENVLKNQLALASNLADEYDYIVCGTGSSGSVVAGRLASDPKLRVLVLEAGGSDESELVMDPTRWPMTLGTEFDWGFVAEPSAHLNGRAIPYSMGKGLGGGSTVNVSTWSRGHRADWDFYAREAADPNWSYEAALRIYRERVEAWTGAPDPEYRGKNGVVHVQPAAQISPFSLSLLEGAASVGLTRYPNANGCMMEQAGGCSFVDETILEGRRQSIFRSYLYPLMDRPNVTVLTGALACKILFLGKRSVGVEFIHNGKLQRVRAALEIVLSAGAIQTPKLLMQSGIGDPEELAKYGIPPILALCGVGRNLHDHVAFDALWETAGDPLPPVPRGQTVFFWKTDPTLDAPNFYAYARRGSSLSPENAKRFNVPADVWSFVVGMRPASRGRITLTGPNPSDPVRINAGYLSEPKDLDDLSEGMKMLRAVGNSRPLASFRGREVLPGDLRSEELKAYFRDELATFWHQSCTAKMGRDEMSVVDGNLKVYGVEGLRIADASILPRVTTGNTMAPSVVIGERAAMLLQAAQ